MADNATDLLELTTDIVTAFVGNNSMDAADMPQLIAGVHQALSGLGAEPIAPVQEHVPAVSARKSVADPQHILSMIDGKPYKSLRRHLSRHGLTPEEYRRRYKLAADYPMVAPSFSEQRRGLAKQIGLGRKRAAADQASSKADDQSGATGEVAGRRKTLKLKLFGAEALAKVRGEAATS